MNKFNLLCIPLILSGCNYSSMAVTVGGNQDMNLARQIIESGGIPYRDSFTAEGLFSEHDLPISNTECQDLLCPKIEMAQMTNLENEQFLLAQLGFATNITSEHFQRRTLNISAAVDISGSMQGDKLDMAKEALLLMVDQLNEDDHMSLVTYGTAATIRKRTLQMNDYGKWAMRNSIENLRTKGSTNMEAGMLLSYRLVENGLSEENTEHRVMLFTDAQPNTGSTEPSSFLGITREYADKGIGLSVFGVGLDLGAELTNEIANTQGGNSYFLSKMDYTQQLFADEFDFIVSPIAYNLEVTLNLDEEVMLQRAYGAPINEETNAVSFGASTLFLSSRNGGIGAQLIADELTGKLGSMDIRYENLDGEIEEKTAYLQYIGGEWVSSRVNADDLGVFRMSYLINEIEALEAAAAYCEGSIELPEAIDKVEKAVEAFAELPSILGEESMHNERYLLGQLQDNLYTEQEYSINTSCREEINYQ
jgi:Ca-activated chloride channel homolog